MADSLEFVVDNLGNLLVGFPRQRPGGLLMSLFLAVVGISIGMVVAIGLGSAQQSTKRAARFVARLYVQVIRGVPLVLMLLIVHQFLGTGRLGVTTTSLGSALVTLVLYSSAYQADIIAGGLRMVPRELVEDAQLLGTSRSQRFLLIKLPYGLRRMRPALVGQAITVFKDSSVVVVLGVADLTTTARIALGSDVENAPHWVATYLVVGLLYFAVAFGASQSVNKFERSRPWREVGAGPGVL